MQHRLAQAHQQAPISFPNTIYLRDRGQLGDMQEDVAQARARLRQSVESWTRRLRVDIVS